MGYKESVDLKSKEFGRLRSEDAEIGEKIDFSSLIYRHIDEVRRMKLSCVMLKDTPLDDYGFGYFASVQSLRDLVLSLLGKDDVFLKKLAEIDVVWDKTDKENEEYNVKIREYEKNNGNEHDPSKHPFKLPNYYYFGQRYFIITLEFTQRKGLGFTEISTEAL